MLTFSQRRKLSCFLIEYTTFEKEVFAGFFEVLYFLKFFDFEKLLHEFYTIYLYHTLFPVNRIFFISFLTFLVVTIFTFQTYFSKSYEII